MNQNCRLMDYHHLDGLADESLDGVYTLETFVLATDPERALAELFGGMKPGCSIALFEYDYPDVDLKEFPADFVKHMEQNNTRATMPSNAIFTKGTLQRMLEDQGFQDVVVKDLSENVKPMMCLFFLVAFIPYIIISFLGLRAWFVNTRAGVEGYHVLKRGLWGFVEVLAKKPLHRHFTQDAVRERRTAE